MTAKEFWDSSCKNEKLKSPADIMNEWAKYHVTKALEAAAENADVSITENALIEESSSYTTYDDGIISARCDVKSILTAYNLNNIK